VDISIIFQALPLWGIFFLVVGLSSLAIEVGTLLGKRYRRRTGAEPLEEIGAMAAAMLGLLGFVVAVTFGTQQSRFDAYRKLELEEATTIHATWLRADMLPDPHRSRIKGLLEEYVRVRIEKVSAANVQEIIEKSEQLQDRIWSESVTATELAAERFPRELYMESLTRLVATHENRVAVGIYQRMPPAFSMTLILLTIMTMGVVGFKGGVSAVSRSGVRMILVIAFSMLVTLISDLNRPESGLLRTTHQPLIDVQERMEQFPQN
jgi:hypothetical protein